VHPDLVLLIFANPSKAESACSDLQDAGYAALAVSEKTLRVLPEEFRGMLGPPKERPKTSMGVAYRMLAHELNQPHLLKHQVHGPLLHPSFVPVRLCRRVCVNAHGVA
jgi:hypothetical protein